MKSFRVRVLKISYILNPIITCKANNKQTSRKGFKLLLNCFQDMGILAPDQCAYAII